MNLLANWITIACKTKVGPSSDNSMSDPRKGAILMMFEYIAALFVLYMENQDVVVPNTVTKPFLPSEPV